MAEALTIPKLGNTVEEVTLVEWLVSDGAQVVAGQGLLEIETDKAVFTVEAPVDGVLHAGPFKVGDVVPVLEAVAIIGAAMDSWQIFAAGVGMDAAAHEVAVEEGAAEGAAPASGLDAEPQPQVLSEARVSASPRARSLARAKEVDLALLTGSGPGGRILEKDVMAHLNARPKVSPVARRLAAEVGIDAFALAGTGPGGRVTRKDVESALAEPELSVVEAREPAPAIAKPAPTLPAALQPLPESETLARIPLKGIRGIIAERMAASVHTTARVTLVMEVDATEFVAARNRLKQSVGDAWGFAPGFNDLLALIVARALRKFPYMNARLTADAIEHLASINLGMAVDTERGLLVPNIKDADRKSLRELGSGYRQLIDGARTGHIHPDALAGGTFTMTSLGSFEVDAFTPVINLPEAAILGVGRIAARPVVRNDEIVARHMMTLSLVFDHRLVDGAPAARFLQFIKQMIEEPYLLLAE